VLRGFAEARVDYLKSGASATNKHQPSDVSTNFSRDFKTGMAQLDNGVNTSNPTFDMNVAMYITSLQAEFPSLVLSPDFSVEGVREDCVCAAQHVLHIIELNPRLC
jgi:hypothetical protein